MLCRTEILLNLIFKFCVLLGWYNIQYDYSGVQTSVVHWLYIISSFVLLRLLLHG